MKEDTGWAKKPHQTTGEEIWRDTDGKVDVLIADGGLVSGLVKAALSQ